jgi:type II secretory pathway component PulF
MTDTATTAVTPGSQTTELKVTVVSMVLSTLAMVIPTIITLVTDLSTKFPSWTWVAPVIGALGLIGQILAALGYQNARTAVKVAALKS